MYMCFAQPLPRSLAASLKETATQGHDIWCSSTEGAYGLSATQITREYCAGMCVQREECKSFDHRRRDGRCWYEIPTEISGEI